MSETEAPAQRPADTGAIGPSFGRRLGAAREALALSVNDIAARLRISAKQVSALEREDLAALPGTAFVRGIVRNYAKEVRIDPAPLLASLNRMLEPASAETPVRATLLRTAERERGSRTLVIAGAIAALIVFAVIGWIANTRSRQAAAPAVADTATRATAPSTTPSATTTGDTAGPAPTEITAPSLPASQPAAAPSEPGALRFGFRDIAWVEVTQQDGAVLLAQNNPAGSEQIVRGKPPYQIVIGNASSVTLEYEGKPIDLKPVTGVANVARLMVK